MVKTENFIQVEIKSKAELRDWLIRNHSQKESIWLVTFKKEVKDKYVSIQEVPDELLCFGWIDGIRRKLDNERTMQLISPRKVDHWAQTYKVRFAKLDEARLVHQSGYDAVLASKKAGLWDFMDDVDNLIVPADLNQALSENKTALDFFEKLSPSNKRFVLRYIKLAKTEKSRQKEFIVTSSAVEKPSIEEVKTYFQENNFPEQEAQKSFNYFKSVGWLVGGKTPMVDWQAAVQNWMINAPKFISNPEQPNRAKQLNTTTDKDYSEPL